MAITWPANLPPPLVAGYQLAIGDALLRFETDVGPPKQRSAADAAMYPVQCTMFMTRAQWQILDIFWRDTLVGGALVFSWFDPIYQAFLALRFRAAPTLTGTDHPDELQVTLQLELLP